MYNTNAHVVLLLLFRTMEMMIIIIIQRGHLCTSVNLDPNFRAACAKVRV